MDDGGRCVVYRRGRTFALVLQSATVLTTTRSVATSISTDSSPVRRSDRRHNFLRLTRRAHWVLRNGISICSADFAGLAAVTTTHTQTHRQTDRQTTLYIDHCQCVEWISEDRTDFISLAHLKNSILACDLSSYLKMFLTCLTTGSC